MVNTRSILWKSVSAIACDRNLSKSTGELRHGPLHSTVEWSVEQHRNNIETNYHLTVAKLKPELLVFLFLRMLRRVSRN